MSAIIAMLIALAAGWFCRRRALFEDNAAEAFNRFVLWICLPALILARVPGLQLRSELLALALAPWMVSAVIAALVLLIGRWLAWPRPIVGCLLLVAVLGNTAFLGYPIIEALRGPELVPLAAVYDQFGTFLLTASYGMVVVAAYSGQARPTLRQMLMRILGFAPFIALVVALLLPGPLPDPLRAIAEALAAPLLPLVAFALGLKLQLRLPVGRWQPLLVGLTLKLVLMPLLAWALLAGFPLATPVLVVGVMEAGMPPMFTAAALAISARIEPELSAAMVGYGLVAGLATVMAWSWLMPG